MNLRKTSLIASGVALGAIVTLTTSVFGSEVASLIQFTSGTTAVAADVNANFESLRSAVNDNNARLDNLDAWNRVTYDGDPATSGVALSDAITLANGIATAADPVVIEIGPGTYDRTGAGYIVPQYVSLHGAGQKVTRVMGAIQIFANTEVSNLWLDGQANLQGSGLILHDIRINGVVSASGAVARIYDFHVACVPGPFANGRGVFVANGGSVTLSGGRIDCNDNATNDVYGAYVSGSNTSLVLENVSLSVSGSSTATAMFAINNAVLLASAVNSSTSGGADLGGDGSMTVRSSLLASATATALVGNPNNVQLISTQIQGTLQGGGLIDVCIGNYNLAGPVACP